MKLIDVLNLPLELEPVLAQLKGLEELVNGALSNLEVVDYTIGTQSTTEDLKAMIGTESLSLLSTGYLAQRLFKAEQDVKTISYLYMLSYFRSLPHEKRHQAKGELNELTSGNESHLGDKLFMEINLDLDDVINNKDLKALIILRDQVVSRTRALRIAFETSGLNMNDLELITRNPKLLHTVLGLRTAAAIENNYTNNELSRLKTLLNVFDHVEGAAINLTHLADGQIYIYDEYLVKLIVFDQNNHKKSSLSLHNEGVEHLIGLDMAKRSGELYHLTEASCIINDRSLNLLIKSIAGPLLTDRKDDRFTSWDSERYIWRSAGLGSRFYELERPNVDVVAMATIDREVATYNQIETELENWRIFNRRPIFMLIDDSGVTRDGKPDSPNPILDANIRNLERLHKKFGDRFIHLTYENRDSDQAAWAEATFNRLEAKLKNNNLEPVLMTILKEYREGNILLNEDGCSINKTAFTKYISSNIFRHISGVRNYTFLKALGYRVMSEDDDAPPETYVVLPKDLEQIRNRRETARNNVMKELFSESSKILGKQITSEEQLYQFWVNETNPEKLTQLDKLEDIYFGYSKDGDCGLIPQAVEQIRTYSSHYMDPRYKRTHQRYEGLSRPQAGHDQDGRIIYEDLPEYLITINDFYYRPGRIEKDDNQCSVFPVNIIGSTRDLGKKVKDTNLMVFSNNLRHTVAMPADATTIEETQEKIIEYIAFPFINDHDTSGMAQFIRYLLSKTKFWYDLQHTHQSSLIVNSVRGYVTFGYAIFNRSAFRNFIPGVSIGRELRLEEPPYIPWVKSPLFKGELVVSSGKVGGGQQRQPNERNYCISQQDNTEVLGTTARRIYEKAVENYYEHINKLPEDDLLKQEDNHYGRSLLLGNYYIDEAKAFKLNDLEIEQLKSERNFRSQMATTLGIQIVQMEEKLLNVQNTGEVSNSGKDALQPQLQDMCLILVQMADDFDLYNALDRRKNDYSPKDPTNDYFYRLRMQGATLFYKKVSPQLTVENVKGIMIATKAGWVELEAEKQLELDETNRTSVKDELCDAIRIEIEPGRFVFMEKDRLPEDGQEFYVTAASQDHEKDFIIGVEKHIMDYVQHDGEAIALWAILTNEAQKLDSSHEMDELLGIEANRAPKEVYREIKKDG